MNNWQPNDYMRAALEEAQQAFEEGDVPVGAVVVLGDRIIGRGRNQREKLHDPTAHAEVLALRAAAESLGTWRLEEAEMYVTLEPCTMCAGALLLARVKGLYFGAVDPKAGAVVSLHRLLSDRRLNHQVKVFRGILEKECQEILSLFFSTKRCISP